MVQADESKMSRAVKSILSAVDKTLYKRSLLHTICALFVCEAKYDDQL